MKRAYSFIILAASLLAVSCNKINQTELALKQRLCVESMRENEIFLAKSVKDASYSSNPRVIRAVDKAKKIIAWKNNYLDHKTRSNLAGYSDTILMHFKKIPRYDQTVKTEIENNLRDIASADTMTVLNLFYWTLAAEEALLDANAREMGLYCGFSRYLSSFTNQKVFSEKDTVYLTVNSHCLMMDSCRLDFSRVTCRNTGTNSLIHPKVIKQGPFYLLIYRPKEEGSYLVEGKVSVANYQPDFDYTVEILNDFVVK